MKTKLLTALLMVLLSSPAFTQPVNTIGNVDCGEWMARKNNKFDELRSVSWLMGLMTGFNSSQSQKNPIQNVSAKQMELWMDNYCKANPLKTVFNGGQILMMELLKK